VLAPDVRRVRTDSPIDLGLTFGPLVRGAYDPTSRFTANAWWRAWNSPDGPVTTRCTVTPADATAEVAAWGDGASWALDHAPEWFGVVNDEPPFRSDHPVVAPLVHALPGLRLTRIRTVHDIAVPTVIEQRVTSLEARRTWARIVRRFGTRAPGPADLYVAPAPSVLATLADHTRHSMGLEYRRGSTISLVANEARRLDRAAALDSDALTRRLGMLRGVGPWTVATVVHYVQGDPDAVPVGDWHLPSMVAWALAGEHKADDARMLELLEPFRPHRARVWRLIVAGAPMPPRRTPRARIEDRLRKERHHAYALR
jgi:3-methyladenine DNA glycosylase/8-oxoguanine DNA glycosylase